MEAAPEVLEVLEFERIRAAVGQRAASILGRKVAGRMRPIRERGKLQRSLGETSEMVHILRERERFPLAGLADIEDRMEKAKAKGQPLEPEDLRDFSTTFATAAEARAVLERFADAAPRLAAYVPALDDFPAIRERIAATIDAQGKVRDDATEKLKSIREEITSITKQIHKRLERVLDAPRISKFLQDRRISLRGGRFVVAVKSGARGQVEGILHDRSQTGATIYVEPKDVVELGNTLTEAMVDEAREVSRILRELTGAVFEAQADVLRSLRTLAWIDFTYAKARISMEYGMSEPEIGEGLDLRSFRHPILIEVLGKDAVVPISLRLAADEKAMVITGPNSGGKTVALKSVGVAVLMAHAGLHLPCDPGSGLPFYDTLYVDIGDEQSLETSLSTFSSHMVRLVRILKDAGPGSLVLIDELGTGTDPAEGSALGEAILTHLIDRGARVLVTTHLGALKAFAFQQGGAVNAAVEFDLETLEPLYKIAIGAPGNSHALAIARRFGVPEEVAGAAERRLEGDDDQGKDLIARIQKVRLQTERSRDETLRIEHRARAKEQAADEQIRENEARKLALSREADRQMEDTYRTLRGELDDYEKDLGGASERQKDRFRALREALDSALSHTPFGRRREEFVRGLKKGRRVFLIKFGKEGEVARIYKSKGRLSVRMGKVTVETGFDDVSWVNQLGRPVDG